MMVIVMIGNPQLIPVPNFLSISYVVLCPLLQLSLPSEPHHGGHYNAAAFATPEIVRNLNYNMSPPSPRRHTINSSDGSPSEE